jgi:SAM-dependent methyltransferase
MTDTLGMQSTGSAAAAAPVYTLGTDPDERARLQRRSDDLAAHTVTLLQHAELARGRRVLELGCGPAGSIELLAERVGPRGTVTAVDADPEHVALARRLVRDRRLDNVEVVQADGRHTGLPSGAFDLVHARLLLVDIPAPQRLVTEMVRLVKPGGWVLAEEVDAAARICCPPHEPWDRLNKILDAAYLSDGADLCIGRKLTSLLREAGVTDIATEVGADPDTLTMSCLYLLAWGRKPTGRAGQ